MDEQLLITPQRMGIVSPSINRVVLRSISWRDFKGQVPEDPPYFAHIFWNISYLYNFPYHQSQNRPRVQARPIISKRSWVRDAHSNDCKLLKHEYTHYLIGCLCALEFQDRVRQQSLNRSFRSQDQAASWCAEIFKKVLNQYLQLEIQYDEETNHYYNEQEQIKWQIKIVRQINAYFKPVDRKATGSERSTSQTARNSSVQSQKQNKSKELNARKRPPPLPTQKSTKNIPFVPRPKTKVTRKYSENLSQEGAPQLPRPSQQVQSTSKSKEKGQRKIQTSRGYRITVRKTNFEKKNSVDVSTQNNTPVNC